VSDDRPDLASIANWARINGVRMVGDLGFGYLGQVFSAADILTVVMAHAWRPELDRFVLSPSHYVTAMYAIAVEIGLLDREKLDEYGQDGSALESIGSERTPVVDFTCGSLAQGLSVGIGYALANRLANNGARTIVFGSDGEMEEGQTWEAAMFASHHGLSDLTLVIDCNDSQVDGPVSMVTTIEPLADKWTSFGWEAVEVDGHDLDQLVSAFARPSDQPKVIVARTSPTADLAALEGLDDAHFIKLDEKLKSALVSELEARR
jgi:transketolase